MSALGDRRGDAERVEGLALSLDATGLLNLPLADTLDIDCYDAAPELTSSTPKGSADEQPLPLHPCV